MEPSKHQATCPSRAYKRLACCAERLTWLAVTSSSIGQERRKWLLSCDAAVKGRASSYLAKTNTRDAGKLNMAVQDVHC